MAAILSRPQLVNINHIIITGALKVVNSDSLQAM